MELATTIHSKKQDFKILWYFFQRHQFKMLFVFLIMAVSGLLEALNLAVLYPILNYGLNIQTDSIKLQFLDHILYLINRENLFFSSCILLIVVSLVAALMKFIYHFVSNDLLRVIVAENQNEIFKKYTNAEYKYFVKSQQGKLVYAGTVATLGVSNSVILIIRIFNSAFALLFFFGLLTILSWQGTVIMLALGLVYAAFIKQILQYIINKYSHLSINEDQKKNIILNEFITGIKTIRAFANFDFWRKKYAEAVDNSALYGFRVYMGRALPDIMLKCGFFVCIAITGIVMHYQFSADVMPYLPIMGTFVGVMSRIVPYGNLLGNDIVLIARHMPDTRIVYNTLHEKMEPPQYEQKPVSGFKEGIEFQNVWFKYDTMDDYFLKGISFAIEKGKVTAVVGPSGVGKTSIVSLLLKFHHPQEGSIVWDGEDIKSLDTSSYLAHIGYVPQETFLYNGTVADNIRFGQEKVSMDEVAAAAKLANAHEFIEKTEAGYETMVGDAGMKLSAGQRQRIAIARVILRKPEIFIFDEATSSLDNLSEQSIKDAIDKIARQSTVLIIAHRLSTVKNADKIIVVHDGRIVEHGTHKELIENKGNYFQLFSVNN